ncbi:uncharacterized protein LOC133184247 [Saccostrea echinata]|uniref:uncharacterized protein LOC133184247 n=1 Tax=Saccostrea echinata TaxID=191078 RepID=UPI002A828AA8|nr:uncharacterized protein LOC133184247 [Saccostrea echinata]
MDGDRAIKCGFCHLGTEVESICGKLHYDNKNTAAHHKCMQYSADLVQYKFASFGGFKIDKVEKEIQRGKRLKCTICKSDKSRYGKMQGATAGCAISKCSKTFHFYCAKLDDVAVTKRMEVRYLKENDKLVMYRVFCGPAHYDQFKKDKGALKKQHRQINKDCSDEEPQSGDEDEQSYEAPLDSLNTQLDEDILMISQLSDNDANEDNNQNLNESSDSDLEDPLNSTTGNRRTKTVDKKGDNHTLDDSRNCQSDNDSDGSDFVEDENVKVAKCGNKSSKVTVERNSAVRENSAKKGKLETPKVQKTPNTKNSLTKSKAAEKPESLTPKINIGGSTKKMGQQQVSVKDTRATQNTGNEKGKQNKNSSPVRGKNGITERRTEEGERDDSSDENIKEDDGQNLIESSDSELEDPFNNKVSNTEQKSLKRNVKNNSLNNSKVWKDNDSEESDISGDENEVVEKDLKKTTGKSKMTVVKKSADGESSVKKGRFDTTKSNKTPVTKNSSKVSKTTEPSASSTPKKNVREPSKKLPIQQKIITQAELHVTTSPSSGDENTDDEATSNGVYHSSDDEPIPSPTVLEKVSSSPQKARNDPGKSNPNEEFSSESEWEENATFPDCALAISSTKKVWPLKRDMIPQKARELFDVQYAKSWSQSASFSNQLSDDHLPYIMKIIADMVRDKMFKKLCQLLTDCSYQLSQMESINHLLSLDDDLINNVRESLLAKVEKQEVNGEVVLIMDSKLNTLFLKLNDTVDRVCKIRSQLFPNAKELSSCLYEWKENTVSAIPPNHSDIDFEWKGISVWLKKEGWDRCEQCIYPSQDIFLASVENKSIEKLIECHHSKDVMNNRKKLIFVRAMDDMVNLDMFIQRLISSCAKHRNVLIISHAKPPITIKSLLPSNMRKGIEVKVMSAFKPSNKRGISVVVISVSNPNWQQQQRCSDSVPARTSEDEIIACPEDDVARDRKRRSLPVRTSDPQSKRKRKF